MLTCRIFGMIAQLRFGYATSVAMHSADIALADVNPELRDIEQSHPMAFLFQMVSNSKRELGGFWDIGGVLAVPVARGQQ